MLWWEIVVKVNYRWGIFPSKSKPDKSGEKRRKSGTKKSRKDKSGKDKKDKKAKKDKSPLKKTISKTISFFKEAGGVGGSKSHKSTKGKSKKASQKKTLDLYHYSELVVHSSEDDLYGYKDEDNLELEADLGWDPTTYYPLPRKMHELSDPIEANKPIQLKDLSSPAVLHNNNEDEEVPVPYCKLAIS